MLSAALSESNSIVTTAMSASSEMLGKIAADAKVFEGSLLAYERNPALFRQLLMTESWQAILANADDKFINLINDPANGKPYELRIQLNREAESDQDKERRQKQKTGQTPANISK